MSMNFSYRGLSDIFCSCVSSDGYEVSNLMSDEDHNRRKGFQAERFTRVPVYVAIKFPVPIQLQKIVIKPWVGQQCAKVIKVLSSQRPLKSDNKMEILTEISFNIARATVMSQTVIAFINPNYRNSYHLSPSSCELDEDARTIALEGKFTNITAIKIGILQMLRGSVPSIQALDIWGCPSFRCDKKASFEIMQKWRNLLKMKNTFPSSLSIPIKPQSEELPTSSLTNLTNEVTSNVQIKSDDRSLKEQFLDPLVCVIMKNPVLLPSGHTIDQRTLDKHIQAQAEWGRPPSDPFTGLAFTEKQKPVPNVQLKLKLDRHALESFSPCKIISSRDGSSSTDANVWSGNKRQLSYESQPKDKKRKIDYSESSKSTANSMLGSLETSLSAARFRNAQFRTVQLNNNNLKPNNIYCAKCNAFLSSTVVQYILPCEHKLCRTCCLKISTVSKTGRKHCPNCQTSFLNSDVHRTFL